jgi:integrase/recombinase XerD
MREREPEIAYVSALAPYLRQFVAEKRALGYRYRGEPVALRAFDRFLAEHQVPDPDLAKSVVEAWVRKRPHESVHTQQDRLYLVRQFSLFLIRRGFSPCLPGTHLLPRDQSLHLPHIFTREQIKQLLAAAQQLRPDVRSPRREIMFPLIFRLLYGCGLRVNEALRLRVIDVDLARGVLTIREAKFRKDRLVPITPRLAGRLRGYATIQRRPRTTTDFFFPAPDGGPFHQQTIHDVFRQLLRACRIPYQGRGKGPRLHDLRHTFAVHRLMMWYRDEVSLGVALPVLATYMGHESLSGTQRYLRLTAEMYPDLVAALQARYGQLIPRQERP